jgi:tRNA (guanine26-N2/guanine27-N2)-dimethyltransferase
MILGIMELLEAVEGRTRFFIPGQDEDSAFPPGTAPVFYNRRMELNRDATVLLLQVIHPEEYIDTMGATGVRGLRVAQECGIKVTINDRDSRAVDLISKNVAHSGISDITVTKSDVNVLLSGQRFDAVDLDPFGTPAPFIDSAIRSARRFLMVTATDTAPLCGAHKKAGIRRYFSQPLNNEYHSETGLRTLLGFVVREALKYDIGLVPQFCFAHEHFVRLHLHVRRGAAAAERTLASIGYIMQCPKCPSHTEQLGMVPPTAVCEHCGSRLIPVGPLWLGAIQEEPLLDAMAKMLPMLTLGTSRELATLLTLCRNELSIAGFYDYHQLAKRERRSPPPMDDLLERIQSLGFPATRCHYLGTGVKTTAPLPLLLQAVKGDC